MCLTDAEKGLLYGHVRCDVCREEDVEYIDVAAPLADARLLGTSCAALVRLAR